MTQPQHFQYDVFLSHSSKDKPTLRNLTDRLQSDDLKVCFHEFTLKPGDNIPAKIEQGLEQSRNSSLPPLGLKGLNKSAWGNAPGTGTPLTKPCRGVTNSTPAITLLSSLHALIL